MKKSRQKYFVITKEMAAQIELASRQVDAGLCHTWEQLKRQLKKGETKMKIKLNRNKLYEAFTAVLWTRYVEPEVELKHRGWQNCRGQRDMYKSCVCFHARNALQKFLGMSNKDFNDIVPSFNSGTAHSYMNKRVDGGKINLGFYDERCVALAHDFINKNPELFINIFNVKKYPVLSDAFDAEMTRPSKVPCDRR